MHKNREQAINMRRSGASYKEITAATGISKGTLSYMLRNIALSEKQKIRLRQRQADSGRRSMLVRSSNITTEMRRNWGRKTWTNNRERAEKNAAEAREKAHLTYLPHELKIRTVLEKIFGKSFRKEKIACRFFDFANSELLIEHSFDYGKGIADIVKRFTAADAAGDRRRRIAYINLSKLGKKRREQLSLLRVEIRDCLEVI